jgi:deoxyadenosine/deoxycytidine kinase
MKQYSIAFAGAGGVGKGTLGNSLSHELNIPFIPSSIQNVGKLLCPLSKNFNDMYAEKKIIFQYCSVMSQIQNERLIANNHYSFIAERSVIDFIPYFESVFKNSKYDYYCHEYKMMIVSYLKQFPYDLIIHIPIEFNPSLDDLKMNSWKERNNELRINTDNGIIQLLKEYSYNYITVSGTNEERLQQCLNIIKKM